MNDNQKRGHLKYDRLTADGTFIQNLHFIGIGVPKAGTTWLSRCLEAHPSVCFSNPKETHFFSSSKITTKKPVPYGEAFSHCDVQSELILGEFTPTYIYEKNLPEKVRLLNPDIKLIVMLREPVSQLISKFRHFHHRDPKNDDEFLRVVFEDERLLEQACYEKYLKKWLRFFSKDEILFLDYDSIRKRPLNVIRDTYSFLNIDTDYVPVFFQHKFNTGFERKSKTLQNLKKMRNILYGTASKYPRILSGLRKIHWGLISTLEKANTKNVYTPSKKTRKLLYDRYFLYTTQEVKKMSDLPLENWRPFKINST